MNQETNPETIITKWKEKFPRPDNKKSLDAFYEHQVPIWLKNFPYAKVMTAIANKTLKNSENTIRRELNTDGKKQIKKIKTLYETSIMRQSTLLAKLGIITTRTQQLESQIKELEQQLKEALK